MKLDLRKDRKSLLKGLDGLKRSVDANGMINGMDAFTQAAFYMFVERLVKQFFCGFGVSIYP